MLKRVVGLLLLFSSSVAWGAAGVDFSLPDTGGKVHRLSDYRGMWVVVNYWATWCPPCLEEIPELSDFHDKNKSRNTMVLGINYEEVDTMYLKTFVDEYFISYPVLRADLNQAAPFGRIHGLPATFIVSPEGTVVYQTYGKVTYEQLDRVLREKQQRFQGKKL